MTTAAGLAISHPAIGALRHNPRGWTKSLWRALIFWAVFSVIFLPEFSRDGTADAGFSIYAKAISGFRYIDLAIFFAVLVHALAHACDRRKAGFFPKALARPGIAFLVCIAAAIYYGNQRQGSNFFFDWRGLALGVGMYVVWSYWLRDASHVAAAVTLFAVYAGGRIAVLYALYLAGCRDTLLGVPIPVFDGPVLSCIVFTALLAMRYQENASGWIHKLLWSGLAAAAYLIVVLCFRRTYWGELALGTLILLFLQKRNRLRKLALLSVLILIAAGILGAAFTDRLQSLNVTSDETQFSADNADHLNDLADAWEQVRLSPVMGIGVGTSYRTWHIRNWKQQSVMVHNAPLHVWLKYGIAGLFSYLWFHVALLRWLHRRSRASIPCRPFFNAAFAYLAAQFVITLGFAPWPYSELQSTTLIAFIVATAVAADRQPCLPQRYESSIALRYHAVV